MPCETSDLARMSDPVRVAMPRLLGSLKAVVRRYPNSPPLSPLVGLAGRRGKGCHTECMSRSMTRSLLGLGMMLALLGAAGSAGAPARAAQLVAPETLDRSFRLEWSRSGKNL